MRSMSGRRDAPKVSWYASHLSRGGPLIAWPVHVLRSGDGFTYVRGLAGRFKGREFSVVQSEITSYFPPTAKLAPGADAYHPKHHLPTESLAADRLRKRIARIPYSEGAVNPHVSAARARRLLAEAQKIASTLRPRSSGDLAWEHFDISVRRAEDAIAAGRTQYALPSILAALDMIRGAAERTSRDPRRTRRR